jgi:hypothetical protein
MPHVARAWPVALVALLPLWVVASAASRGRGHVFFGAGVAALALALAAFTRGRRNVLFAYVYVLVLLAALALTFEAALYLRPALLRGRLANIAYNGYHWQAGGVYELDAHRGPVLRPHVRRTMYWNGYWWRHESGQAGWRGPDASRADAVFLGDSMIYGHGVEEAQTLAARFAARTGLSAVNLGQQGTCQIQSLLTLARHAPGLRPRFVFASLHPTDPEDAPRIYDAGELRRFADAPDGSPYEPTVRPDLRPPGRWHPGYIWTRFVALPLRCSGLAGAIARSGSPGARAADQFARDPFVPTAGDIELRIAALEPDAPEDVRLAWRAEKRAVLEMKRLCDRLGARLVVLDLGYPRRFSGAVEALAREAGAAYSDAGRQVLARSQAGERVYLANDGHWSQAGTDAMAEALARDVKSD